MHLMAVTQMLPFFNASGHNLYAKCAQLYVQQMRDLPSRLSKEHYRNFCDQSFFTVRRTNQFWSGVWTDMCIEQYLMRSIKVVGGLSLGRGVSDDILLKWILCTPVCSEIIDSIETFTGTNTSFRERHVDLRDSRQSRDSVDRQKFIEWFQQHNPFWREMHTLFLCQVD